MYVQFVIYHFSFFILVIYYDLVLFFGFFFANQPITMYLYIFACLFVNIDQLVYLF